MELIALHFLGDFALQNDWMAINKAKSTGIGWLACFIHCLVYSLPFWLFYSTGTVLLIFTFHFIIDKFSLAKLWAYFFNIGMRFPLDNWVKGFLILMVDMSFHFATNLIAVR